jgi:FMN reductase
MTARLVVVSAGLSQPSSTRLLADQLAEATTRHLPEPASVVAVELRDLAHDITNAMLTGFAPPALQAVLDELAAADAVIAVTPTFNASFSGLFKSFFDVVGTEILVDTPVLLGATGGTERHSLVLEHALRPMFSYLHAVVSPTGVYAATHDFGAQDGSVGLSERIGKAADDFARLLQACGPRARRDVFAEELTEMEHLLAGWQQRDGRDDVED